MTFLELESQYQAYKEELTETLNALGEMCSNFVNDHPEYFEGMEYVSNPYELSYNEKYDTHLLDFCNNLIWVQFSHKDSYDEICDSNTRLKYPLHWVEALFNGEESNLGSILHEVKDSILKHNNIEITNGKREAIYEALRYNLISKEVADKMLSELN